MQKHLIVNPTKAQKDTYAPLDPVVLKKAVFDRALGNATYPLLITGTHLGRLINNIEYKVKAITDWINYEAKDREDADQHLNRFADALYGKNWEIKLLKSEVMYSKPKTFGLICPNEELVQQIRDALINVATVEVNKPKAGKPNKTTEGSNTKKEENNE